MSCGINERPKGPKVALHRQGRVLDVARYIPLNGLPVWDNISGPPEPSSYWNGSCRNCGASHFKQGKCEYCGTNQ
jgi:hypothetical protein